MIRECSSCGEQEDQYGGIACGCMTVRVRVRAEPHVLYTPGDFTNAEYESGSGLARMVIDGGLEVCKKCGAGEAELTDYRTCTAYRERTQQRFFYTNAQRLIDGLDARKPFILMPHYLDRLILHFDRPDDWLVLTTSAAIRGLLRSRLRNPSGARVETFQKVTQDGALAKNVLMLGSSRIGHAQTKFHRLLRSHQTRQTVELAICVDSALPPMLKLFPTALALGLARKTYGHYSDFMEQHFYMSNVHGNLVPVRERHGAARSAYEAFLGMTDTRFAKDPFTGETNLPKPRIKIPLTGDTRDMVEAIAANMETLR